MSFDILLNRFLNRKPMDDKLSSQFYSLQCEVGSVAKYEFRLMSMERHCRLRKIFGTYDKYLKEYDWYSGCTKYLDFNEFNPRLFPFKKMDL